MCNSNTETGREDLEEKLGYHFVSQSLFQEALTHRSFTNETPSLNHPSYERLEFLGDAVLELIIADHLLKRFPDFSEGQLTKLRSSLVQRSTLAKVAKRLGIGPQLYLGKGEKIHRKQHRDALLADVFEAILGAIYLEVGFEKARHICCNIMKKELDHLDLKNIKNYKSLLQTTLAHLQLPLPTYQLISSQGPDHEPIFVMEGVINEQFRYKASGKNKKEATLKIAKQLYHQLIERIDQSQDLSHHHQSSQKDSVKLNATLQKEFIDD